MSEKIALSSGALAGMKQQIRHRLNKRAAFLTPKERAFLEDLWYKAQKYTSFSEKQLRWYFAIMRKTDRKAIAGQTK
ncbi:hypothetical protein [Terasakiella sp.]|uniref:hypothetical protein n=1 Tax=Terasakiella sp. TaxID=2034861 RepID=UPI003AA816A8